MPKSILGVRMVKSVEEAFRIEREKLYRFVRTKQAYEECQKNLKELGKPWQRKGRA